MTTASGRHRGLIDMVLDPAGLRVCFQPVLQLDGDARRLLCLEALVRGPEGSNMETAAVLFDYVRRKREEVSMDRICVQRVLSASAELDRPVDLAINVHAATLSRDPEFLTFLGDAAEQHGVALSRLILEIAHTSPLWEGESLASSLDALRHIGVRLALDEVGLGQASLQMILDCKPDFLKVDGYLVQGSATDFHRQVILEAIAGLARRFGARVVAEAVEKAEDLAALQSVGIDLAQGFLFGPPVSAAEIVASGQLHSTPPVAKP